MKQKHHHVKIRFMHEADIEQVLACEHSSHEHNAYIDEDFGVKQLPDYVWTKNDILSAVSQYQSRMKGTNDTRAMVAEVSIETVKAHKGIGGPQSLPWVCGAMIFEYQVDALELRLFTVHKEAPNNVRDAMLNRLMSIIQTSETRGKLKVRVPDGDYENLKFFQNKGFKLKLIPNMTGNDTWMCSCEVGGAAVAA